MGNNLPSEYACWERKITASRLPSAYQEVEYIASQSGGGQYIDTGVKMADLYGVKLGCTVLGQGRYYYGYNAIFGVNDVQYDTKILYNVSSNVISLQICSVTAFTPYFTATIGTKFTLEYRKNGCWINGEPYEYTYSSTRTQQPNYNIYLFNANMPGSQVAYSYCRMYNFVIYDDDENAIRNFIPCYRKSDSVAGMYDLVNDVFYTNAGTGTFTVGADVITTYPCYKSLIKTSILPSEYTELEYIESSGTQYINTGVIPTTSTGLYADATYPSSSSIDNIMIGVRQVSSTNTRFWIDYDASGSEIGCGYGSYTERSSRFTNAVGGTRYITTVNYLNDGYMKVDGTAYDTLSTHTWSSTTFTRPIYLFCPNIAGTSGNYGFNGRVYELRITEGSALTHDYIPAKRNSDSVIGMYDTVTNTFYTNAGTGTFIAGAEVGGTYSLYKRLITA